MERSARRAAHRARRSAHHCWRFARHAALRARRRAQNPRGGPLASIDVGATSGVCEVAMVVVAGLAVKVAIVSRIVGRVCDCSL
jgi:hypothetical protein